MHKFPSLPAAESPLRMTDWLFDCPPSMKWLLPGHHFDSSNAGIARMSVICLVPLQQCGASKYIPTKWHPICHMHKCDAVQCLIPSCVLNPFWILVTQKDKYNNINIKMMVLFFTLTFIMCTRGYLPAPSPSFLLLSGDGALVGPRSETKDAF